MWKNTGSTCRVAVSFGHGCVLSSAGGVVDVLEAQWGHQEW